jgi:hypothetical protein
MTLPTRDEINVYNSLDEISATEHFLNKTLEDAEALFRENSLRYQEDLMWMGPRAFHFYLQAALNYLRSDASTGDDHFIYCLYKIVLFRMDEKEFVVALDVVNRLIDYVIGNYKKFAINSNVYGDLLGKYVELKSQLKDVKVI